MKKLLNKFLEVTLTMVIVLASGYSITGSAELTGEQIAIQAKYRNRAKSILNKSTMILQIETGGVWKTVDSRKTASMSIQVSDKLQRSLFRFIGGLKNGVTSLSIEQADQIGVDDIQYIYTPSLRRPRRVAPTERQNEFEDTDFTNEDLGGKKISEYTYKRLPDETYRDEACYVIEAYRKNLSNAKFYKFKSWLTKKHFIPIRSESYNLDKRLSKKMFASNIKQYGNIFLAHQMQAISVDKRHKTIIVVEMVRINVPVNKNEFESNAMDAVWRI